MDRLHGLRSLAGRAFSVYPGEWNRLLLLYMFAFALNTSVIWGQATSDALFLQQIGAQFLPAMFVGDALITVIAILVYSSFVDRISNVRLMMSICVLGSILLLLLRGGLFLELDAVYPLLFLLDRVLRAIITIHAWTVIADFYDTRMAKRHFPLIGSGSRTSGILAGALLFPLSFLLGANNLVLAWLVVLLLCAVLAWLTPRIVPPVTTVQAAHTDRSNVFDTLSEGASLVVSSSFLRLMAVAAVAGTALLYLLEYQSQVIIAASFANAEAQATFYGLLGALADALTLPIQMVLLGRLVTRFGVGNANLIFPGLTALSYGLLAFWPSLISAAIARIDRTALRSAFRTPIDGMLYNAIAPHVKGRARAFINGLPVPLGALCAGLLLLVVAWAQIPAVVLVPLGLALALLYVATAWYVRGEYGHALVNVLETDDLASLRAQRDSLGLTDPATLNLLRQRLAESEDDDTTIFLAEMLYDLAGPQVLPHLRDLAHQRGPQVRASIIVLLGENSPAEPVVRQLCIESLHAEHANVRLAALRALVNVPAVERDTDVLAALLALLQEPTSATPPPELLLPPLIASNLPAYREPAQQMLDGWLDADTGSEQQKRGLRVLARMGDARLLPRLAPYLTNPAPTVRQEALAYLTDFMARDLTPQPQQQVTAIVGNLLDDPDARIRLDAVTALGTIQTAAAQAARRAALRDPSFAVRRQACAQMKATADLADLEPELDSQDCLLIESVTFLLAANVPRARRHMPVLIEQLIRAA
jgi:AAA family ATP:ADP antiporter